MTENQSTPAPRPEAHPLSRTGASAIRSLVDFYDQAIQEEGAVSREWRHEFEDAKASGDRWLGWLREIAQLPLGQKDSETVAQAVTRYVAELTQALVASQARVTELETKVRDLTSENIDPPTAAEEPDLNPHSTFEIEPQPRDDMQWPVAAAAPESAS